MNALVELQKRIELTNEAMARIGRMLKEQPHARGLLVNLETLDQTFQHLKKEYESLAIDRGIEVCTYRLFAEGTDRHAITGIGRALANFQTLFSVTYEAVKTDRPKTHQQITEDVANETLLEFAYSFPGSIGVAFTVPSQASLYGNFFDLAIEQIFRMAQTRNSMDLKAFSKKLGVAPVRAMYRWAHELASSGFGIDVQWKGAKKADSRLYIQMPELITLSAAILATSEETETNLSVIGTLEGVDVPAKTFHFRYYEQDGKRRDVRGKYIDAIRPAHPVSVPGRYKAVIRRTSRTNYSMDKDESEDLLLKLETLLTREENTES